MDLKNLNSALGILAGGSQSIDIGKDLELDDVDINLDDDDDQVPPSKDKKNTTIEEHFSKGFDLFGSELYTEI